MPTKFNFDQIETAAITPFFSMPGAPAPPAIRGARAFLGDGWRHGQQTDGNVTGGSWLQSFVAAGRTITDWDYFEDQARLAVVSNFGSAGAFISRTSGGGDAIGAIGAAVNDGVGFDAWGAYLDAVSANAAAGVTHGLEVDITNIVGVSPMGGATPYRGYTSRMMGALFLAGGSDAVAMQGRSYANDWAINVVNNGGAFHTGLNFRFDALMREGHADDTTTPGNTGYAHAISLAHDHGITWFSRDPLGAAGTQTEAVRMYSTIDNPATLMEVVFGDTTIAFNDKSGSDGALFQIGYIPNAGASVRVLPVPVGSAPIIEAQGTNANINLIARGKGTGLFGAANVAETTSATPSFNRRQKFVLPNGEVIWVYGELVV